MKSDGVLKTRIERELRSTVGVGVGDIVVTVNKGIVTLSGSVRGHRLAHEAERVARRASGTRPVTDGLVVRQRAARGDPDADLVREAVTIIRRVLPYSGDRVRVAARDGFLTVDGELQWPYQLERVEQAARSVRGASGFSTTLRSGRHVTAADVKKRMQ